MLNLSPIAPTSRAIRVRRLYEGFSSEEKEIARKVYDMWYKSSPQIAAWSSPIAVRYISGYWEIFQKGDLVELAEEDLVEEIFDLRYIFGNWN